MINNESIDPFASLEETGGTEIAVIGMACRFPGAETPEEFWRNLRDGVESLTELSDEDLLRAGVSPQEFTNPRYVRLASVVDGIEDFDAGFFGYTPQEVIIMDPQHRLFLECAWEVLERGGWGDPQRLPGPVGVFTGAKTNTHLFQVVAQRHRFPGLDNFQIALGNDLASMATRVSYQFNLRGPSYALHTACSTSLVAVHLACQSLLLDECIMAIAGGASVNIPQRRGYLPQLGGILSPDGSSRTFDEKAAGSNFGNGCGAVLLKRLADALADGDPIHCVIRGSATNNDGAAKASFTAPGVEGQTAVLIEAMACAGIEPSDLSYLEAHGTATELGDSIEILALKQAFRAESAQPGSPTQHCILGSVKTNLGHLEVAAGVAGLIKTALALEHRELPPSLHFHRANPILELESTPFEVHGELRPWTVAEGRRRIAGVSSFGIGSTNAHVVVEEAPRVPPVDPSVGCQILLLSARSATALDTMSERLAQRLEQDPGLELADVAFTLAFGRKRFAHRRAITCRNLDEAIAGLRAASPAGRQTLVEEQDERSTVFLLPGLGDQVLDLARGLYAGDATFRTTLERCTAFLEPLCGLDLCQALYPPQDAMSPQDAMHSPAKKPDLRQMLGRQGTTSEAAAGPLSHTRFAQPALFAVEYSLAQMWIELGIQPRGLLGYSLGEYVAACLAGTLSLEGALTLVARRAQLIDELPAGAMLAVTLAESELVPLLGDKLSLAAVNGPQFTVAAGPPEAVDALAATLAERAITCRRLATSHAFHSAMMEPIAARFLNLVRSVELRAPKTPWVSNVTGTWITEAEAVDADYWVRHLCQPVRFAQGVETLLEGDGSFRDPAVVELGSGQSLSTFVKLHPSCNPSQADRVVATLPAPLHSDGRAEGDLFATRQALARLWLCGVRLHPAGLFGDQKRRRVTLPTYPFERQRLWLDPVSEGELAQVLAPTAPSTTPAAPPQGSGKALQITLDKAPDPADWLWQPEWKPAPLATTATANATNTGSCALLLSDGSSLATAVAEHWRAQGIELVEMVAAADGAKSTVPGPEEHRGVLDAEDPAAWSALFKSLRQQQRWPQTVVLLWNLRPPVGAELRWGFFGLLHLAQALGRLGEHPPIHLLALTRGAHRITGEEELIPEQATVLGPAKVIPQESPAITCHVVDVELPAAGAEHAFASRLLAEQQHSEDDDVLIAWRGAERLRRDFVRRPPNEAASPLREGGTYLITGGLGGLGLVLAEHLGRRYRARLVLVGRSAFPPAATWDAEVASRPPEDPLRVKICALQALEAAGAQVLVCAADVADVAAMTGVREATVEHFGSLHGIIHTAGVPGGGIVQLKSDAMARTILRPKVEGARVLLDVFGALPLDFLAIYSSVASILGEFGQADYCAANAYLDTLAASRWGQTPPVRTINWDIWQDVGLAVYTEVPAHLREWREEMISKGIKPQEGVELFERILALGEPQTIVSTQDLHARIQLGRSLTGERFLEELGIAGRSATPSPATLPTGTPLDRAELEQRMAAIWHRLLGREVQVSDNFFDLGGNSLVGLQLVGVINQELGTTLIPVDLFEHPSIRALVRHLRPVETAESTTRPTVQTRRDEEPIAIIGMAGRFPGARNTEELWRNLRAGVESVSFFSDQELLAAGVDPQLLQDPLYVRAGAILDDIDLFDATLFGYSPREAEVMDPQQRIFLECAWEALETAACDPMRYGGRIGVFAGSNLSTYLLQLHGDPEAAASVNLLQAILGNDKDALTTRVSYKLNLRGPSVGVQTFCSTSLVAIHMAARSLIDGDCDAALAGGIRVVVPAQQGYLWEERGIAPRDGHTYSFDARATGAVLGNGAGVVMLKRLGDALAEGDPIRAVLLGSAINNDGARKAGYTAPSVEGQVQVARDALARAGIDSSTVSYVEAHGSATELGDPIEITALSRAYAAPQRQTPCALGSVKSNFGHLDRAAGVTGLIKTVLALEHREIPASINYSQPNPQIDFASSPFQVQTQLTPWPANGMPRRAAVNSLGMGGTNVHVVLEEAVALHDSEQGDGEELQEKSWQLLVLSAHSRWSLDQATAQLARALEDLPEGSLPAVAQTLQSGRQELRYRRALVCRSLDEAKTLLAGKDPKGLFEGFCEAGERPLVFLFPGLGGQYAGMGRGLYRHQPVFRTAVDHCATFLEPLLGVDLRTVIELLGDEEESDARGGVNLRALLRPGGREAQQEPRPEERRLARAVFAQPALFVVEYALSQVWLSWGLRPTAMLGYSIGEYVAACVAGVLSLEDALTLVARRAQLIEALPAGGMLAVALGTSPTEALIADHQELWIAASNTPEQTVVAGPVAHLDALTEQLDGQGIVHRRLEVSHAFHSGMLDPAATELTNIARGFELSAPRIPYLSNVTGTWMSPEDAVDPAYWSRHMCSPVRFSEGLETLLEGGGKMMVELGPQALASLVLQHPATARDPSTTVIASLRHAFERGADSNHLLAALGKSWLAGAEIDWSQTHQRTLRRLVLPTYAFDRQRYWIETRHSRASSGSARQPTESGEKAPVSGGYSRPQLRILYVAPTTKTQKAICGLWSELLGVADIGINDSFLELGGDSLLASRLISRMREVFGLELPIRLFFEASTVAELSEAVERLREEEDEREASLMMEKIQELSEEDLEKELLRMESLVDREDDR